jgi:cell division GTPase FtsZ
MKLAAVGVGNAGSRVVNRILATEKASNRTLCGGDALLVNSTTPTFDTTEHVPEERRLTIGDAYWEVDEVDIDGDPDLGADVAREERNEINRAFDLIDFQRIDGVLVVAGLGGGTGGGAGSVVIDQLKSICDVPVYAVGVLPGESEGPGPALTAARSLQSFVDRADNVILFDNDTWLPDDPWRVSTTDTDAENVDSPDDVIEAEETVAEDAADATVATDGAGEPGEARETDGIGEDDEDRLMEAYGRVNVELAERLVALFAAGGMEGTLSSETQLDPSDIMRMLDTGGVSSIGYASIDLPSSGGLTGWLRALRDLLPWTGDEATDDDEATDAARINGLVRRAARSKLTLPCRMASADRALIVLSGPPETLSRKGFESGRYWLEREADIVDVMAGNEPHDGSATLTGVVLFSNVTDVPRIDAMQELALEHQPTPTDGGWRFGMTHPS